METLFFSPTTEQKQFIDFCNSQEYAEIRMESGTLCVSVGGELSGKIYPAITDLQIRLALINAGLIDAVEQWVMTSTDKTMRAWWDRALRFERDNPMVLSAASALGVTQKQLDDLWLLAVTL